MKECVAKARKGKFEFLYLGYLNPQAENRERAFCIS